MAVSVTQGFKDTIYSGEIKAKAKLVFDGTELENVDALLEKITIKSNFMKNASKRFALEDFVSQEVDIILRDVDVNELVSPVELHFGVDVDGDYEWVKMGVYDIQDKPETNTGKVSLKLRDFSARLDVKYNAKDLIDETGTATLREILDDISSKTGVTIDVPTFPNEELPTGVYDNTINARQYVSWLASQGGRKAIVDRNGVVKFINIKDLYTHTIPLHIVEKHEDTPKYEISKVVYEDALRLYEKGDDSKDTLFIDTKNPYLNTQNQIDGIYDDLNGFVIDGLKAGKVIGNPTIDSWDLIELVTPKGTLTTLASNRLIYNGVFIQHFETVVGEKDREQNVTMSGEAVFQKYVRAEIDNINTQIELVAGEIVGLTDFIREVGTDGDHLKLENTMSSNNAVDTLSIKGFTPRGLYPRLAYPYDYLYPNIFNQYTITLHNEYIHMVDELPEPDETYENKIYRFNNKYYKCVPVETLTNIEVGDTVSKIYVDFDRNISHLFNQMEDWGNDTSIITSANGNRIYRLINHVGSGQGTWYIVNYNSEYQIYAYDEYNDVLETNLKEFEVDFDEISYIKGDAMTDMFKHYKHIGDYGWEEIEDEIFEIKVLSPVALDTITLGSKTHYDEIFIENSEIKVIQRTFNGSVLPEPVEHKLGTTVVPTFYDETFIQVVNYDSLIFGARYIIQNELTSNFATQLQSTSQFLINQNEIATKVDKDGIISSINQSAEEIKIQAQKIGLEGTVTANNNFKILLDGSIEANKGTFSGDILLQDGSKILSTNGLMTQVWFDGINAESYVGNTAPPRVGYNQSYFGTGSIDKTWVEIPYLLPDGFVVEEAKVVIEHTPLYWQTGTYPTFNEDWGYSRNIVLGKGNHSDTFYEIMFAFAGGGQFRTQGMPSNTIIPNAFGSNYTPSNTSGSSIVRKSSIDIKNHIVTGSQNRLLIYTGNAVPSTERSAAQQTGIVQARLYIIGYTKFEL